MVIWTTRLSILEVRMKMLKFTLKQVGQGSTAKLNYQEFRTLLVRCANAINEYPLGVRENNKTKEEIQPLTPNQLLGRSNSVFCEEVAPEDEHKADVFQKSHLPKVSRGAMVEMLV